MKSTPTHYVLITKDRRRNDKEEDDSIVVSSGLLDVESVRSKIAESIDQEREIFVFLFTEATKTETIRKAAVFERDAALNFSIVEACLVAKGVRTSFESH